MSGVGELLYFSQKLQSAIKESFIRRREKQVANRGFRAGGKEYLDQSCAVVC